jgi:hypothetical protein
LGIEDAKNYRFKSIFLYFIFEEIFVHDTEVSDINIQALIEKTRNYEGCDIA